MEGAVFINHIPVNEYLKMQGLHLYLHATFVGWLKVKDRFTLMPIMKYINLLEFLEHVLI